MKRRYLLLILSLSLIFIPKTTLAENMTSHLQKKSLDCGCAVRLDTPNVIYYSYYGGNQGTIKSTGRIEAISIEDEESDGKNSTEEQIKKARDRYLTEAWRLTGNNPDPYLLRMADIFMEKYLRLAQEKGIGHEISEAAAIAGRRGNLYLHEVETILAEKKYPHAAVNFYNSYIASGSNKFSHAQGEYRPTPQDLTYALDRLIHFLPQSGGAQPIKQEVAEFFAKHRPEIFRRYWNQYIISVEVN